jgi:hypothetical protein
MTLVASASERARVILVCFFMRRLVALESSMDYIQINALSLKLTALERRPPLYRPELLARDVKSTERELRRLIDSIALVRHLTIYGYSNVRLLAALLKKLDREPEFANALKTHLERLHIVFYDYEQIAHINETKSSYMARKGWIDGFRYAMEIRERFADKTVVLINHMRYGFNVLKVIYSRDAEPHFRDQIRLTVPIPGRNFELAPVFTLNRGDPWFHEYLDICERYLEQGRVENDNRITVAEYRLNPAIANKIPTDEKELTRKIEGSYAKTAEFSQVVKSILAEGAATGALALNKAAEDYCATIDHSNHDPMTVARDLWCLREVVKLGACDAQALGNPVRSGLLERV